MRVVVIGAGEVGSYIAGLLSKEGIDVAVIEKNAARLADLERHADVHTILGDGTSPKTLKRAGIERAELLVAVTKSDAANMLACLVGKELTDIGTIARIESRELRSRKSHGIRAAAGVDDVIDPDDSTAEEIMDLLDYPGATDITSLANGEVVVIGATVGEDAPIVGQYLHEIGEYYGPEWDFIIGTITRSDTTVVSRRDHRVEPGDTVRVVSKRRARSTVMKLLGLQRGAHQRVMLLGGGRTAEILAEKLVSRNADVCLVERNLERAQTLAERLAHVLIIEGDITDAELLENEDVASMDAVIALTGEDDANVLACLFAKAQGAKETIAVLHRLQFAGLLKRSGIDAAISPRTASANAVLRKVYGNVAQVATFLLQSEVEVFEIEVARRSAADGVTVRELSLPPDTLVAAIVRSGKATIGRAASTLRAQDHVVVVCRIERVPEIRELFAGR